MRFARGWWGFVFAAGCVAEAPAPVEPMSSATVQRVRVGAAEQDGNYLSFHLLATDAAGAALPCDSGRLSATVRYVAQDGSVRTLPAASISTRCHDSAAGDVAVVVDNSGSESGFLDPVRDGARDMIHGVLDAGGGAGLVRVSTDATVLSPVTSDRAALDASLDRLHVNGGWTALWDGIRQGNEVLARAQMAGQDQGAWPDVGAFCDATEPLGIVAITDGRENNSSEMMAYDLIRYPGDGIDTTIEMLHELRVGGTTTPIYTVGVGARPDHAALSELAAHTGGRHLAIRSAEQVGDVFETFSDYFAGTTQVCASLPDVGCGAVELELAWTWTTDAGEVFQGVESTSVAVACPEVEPDRGPGRSVMFLLTMFKPSIGQATSERLVRQAVHWVTPRPNSRVYLVLDDERRTESFEDTALIEGVLTAAGYDVVSFDEPADGLTPADLDGADVVWFSNPGWPMDDLATRDVLLQFRQNGGGLVLQGDDMTYALGQAFSMTPLTSVEHVGNGTPFCGVRINNRTGNYYQVSIDEHNDHPVVDGLIGTSFLYNDDIDVSAPIGAGERVLAWANLPGGSECPSHPAIVAFDPDDAP
jgi:Mg-chelatase subunit ChlD